MKNDPLKVGDRVRVYGYGPDMTLKEPVGQIVEVNEKTGWVRVEPLHSPPSVWAHPKQCRRLKKKERRRIWINRGAIEDYEGDKGRGFVMGWEIHFTNNGIPHDYIEFIEVKK